MVNLQQLQQVQQQQQQALHNLVQVSERNGLANQSRNYLLLVRQSRANFHAPPEFQQIFTLHYNFLRGFVPENADQFQLAVTALQRMHQDGWRVISRNGLFIYVQPFLNLRVNDRTYFLLNTNNSCNAPAA